MVERGEVVKVAKLAKLEFTESELDQLTNELNGVLGHIDELKEVDVKDVAPLENVNEAVEANVFRRDEVEPSLSREETLRNAPRSADGYFLVPKVLEQEVKTKAPLSAYEEEEELD